MSGKPYLISDKTCINYRIWYDSYIRYFKYLLMFKKMKSIVSKLTTKQDGKCYYCKRTVLLLSWSKQNINNMSQSEYRRKLYSFSSNPLRATKEHIIPICKGGKSDMSNYLMSCNSCNRAKAETPHDDFLEQVSSEHDIIMLTLNIETLAKLAKLQRKIRSDSRFLIRKINKKLDSQI